MIAMLHCKYDDGHRTSCIKVEPFSQWFATSYFRASSLVLFLGLSAWTRDVHNVWYLNC